jgi:hypothetical protein
LLSKFSLSYRYLKDYADQIPLRKAGAESASHETDPEWPDDAFVIPAQDHFLPGHSYWLYVQRTNKEN